MKLPTPEQITRSLEELLRRSVHPHVHRAEGKMVSPKPKRELLTRVERKPADKANLLARTVTGLPLAALTIFLIVVHPHAFAFEVMFFAIIAIKEMCDLTVRAGVGASFPVAVICGIALVVTASWNPTLMGPVLAATVIFTMSWMTLTRTFHPQKEGKPRRAHYLDAVMTVFAYTYTAWLFSFCLPIRLLGGKVAAWHGTQMDAGAAYLLMLVAATAFTDLGCFAFGKLFGRHALAPHISPGKTIEGALGGVLVAVGVAVLFGRWIGIPAPFCIIYGCVVSVVSQLGDLWESMMKREVGMKDSGRALAGHGGVLDRFDSYFFAMPVGYLLTQYMLC